jgi:hypothetical protein
MVMIFLTGQSNEICYIFSYMQLQQKTKVPLAYASIIILKESLVGQRHASKCLKTIVNVKLVRILHHGVSKEKLQILLNKYLMKWIKSMQGTSPRCLCQVD